MKITISLICQLILFTFFVSGQSTTVHSENIIQKSRLKIKSYIKSVAKYPNSYIPVNWSDLSLQHIHDDSEFLTRSNDDFLNSKIDSLIELKNEYPIYKKIGDLYTVTHVFKLKTKSGQFTLSVYSFHLDSNLDIIDVDEGTPEEQIEKLKSLIDNSKMQLRLIKEISERKIELIGKQ